MNPADETSKENDILLDVRGLTKHFPLKKQLSRRIIGTVKAVDDVSFQIHKGQTVGLVGESGCGKTTTGRCILRAIEPTSGQVSLHDGDRMVNVLALNRTQLRRFRRNMQLIFQDPYSSLNPRMTVMRIVGEPLLLHGLVRGADLEDRVRLLMKQVGLDEKFLNRYPHAFSGGQRQRIGIARALALRPSLIVADESVSALDMSMQAQILNLMKQLQKDFDLTYLFIAHDLSVIRHFSDRVLVMYAGKLVENAPTAELFRQPKHPYTEALLSAAPRPDPRDKSTRIVLSGEVPDPANLPSGCAFHPRCPHAVDRCRTETPVLTQIAAGRWASCHLAEELELNGVKE